MIDLKEQILCAVVVVEQVASDTGALSHPVQPDATARSIDVVATNLGVDGRVDLDPGHLGTRE